MDWIRTRSKRDLVLALVVAGAAAVLLGTLTVTWLRGGHANVEFVHEHGGGLLFDRTFDVRSGAELVVRVADVDVDVSATSGTRATVRVMADDGEHGAAAALDRMGFEVEARDGGLEIRTESEGRSWRDHDDFDLRLAIEIPRDLDVRIQTGDGDVAVEAIEGRVRLQTGDGDILLAGATGPEVRIQTGDGDVSLGPLSSGTIQVQTGDGDVMVGRSVAEAVEIRTGDGDIMIEDLSGALEAMTGDGDVTARIADFDGVEIHTGDGDVTIHAAPGLAAELEMIGTEFYIDEVFALPAQLETRRLVGTLNGGGPRLSVRVGDGRIRLIER